jgi:hypothetical protein
MTLWDGIGYLAAALVLLAFCQKQMVPLRIAALDCSFAFLAYGSRSDYCQYCCCTPCCRRSTPASWQPRRQPGPNTRRVENPTSARPPAGDVFLTGALVRKRPLGSSNVAKSGETLLSAPFCLSRCGERDNIRSLRIAGHKLLNERAL